MAKAKQPLGPPMTLGNMRQLGVHRLVAYCVRDACRSNLYRTVYSFAAVLLNIILRDGISRRRQKDAFE